MTKEKRLGDLLAEIKQELTLSERLAQVAEESAELAKAALKYRRALDGDNPTLVTVPDAIHHMEEEISDLWLCLMACGMDDPDDFEIERKATRWVNRLDARNARGG